MRAADSDFTNPPKPLRQSRLAKAYAVTFWCLFAVTAMHRLIAFREILTSSFKSTYQVKWIEGTRLWAEVYGTSTLVGVAADVIFSALLALILAPLGRSFLWIGMAGLSVFYAANIQHIFYNQSHIDLTTLELAVDPTFITGMLSTRLVVEALIIFSAGALTALLLRLRRPGRVAAVVMPLVLITALAHPFRGSFVHPAWIQSHPLVPTALFSVVETDERHFPNDTFSFVPADYPVTPGYNILVLYLEGLSDHSLRIGDMRNFEDLAARSVRFTRYYGTQLITANGLYASLTGDLPNFVSGDLVWADEAVTSRTFPYSIPTRMKSAGYQTAFFQGADLAFMRKDEIMPKMGFDTVKGRESWTNVYSADGWGIDDRALFENVLTQIDALPNDAPWFASVLTTGTHPHYNFPTEFLPEEPSRRYRALRYLDQAIGELFAGLEARELLDKTIVVLTSDESRERSVKGALKGQIALNWLPMVVVHPSGAVLDVDTPMSSTRFGEILSGLLSRRTVESFEDFAFEPRTMVFGNTFGNRFYRYDPVSEEFLVCDTKDFTCAVFDNVEDPAVMADRAADRQARFPDLHRQSLLEELAPNALSREKLAAGLPDDH